MASPSAPTSPAISQAQGTATKLLMVEQGGRGGEADYTALLTRALAQQGWSVELATADDHLYRPVEGVHVNHVFHYTRGHSGFGRAVRRLGLGWASNGLRFLAAVPRLMRLARRCDVVHVQGWERQSLGLIAVLSIRLCGRPIVQTWHNTFERQQSLAATNRALRRLLARITARTIVHTQADLARIPSDVAARTVVIPHGEYGGLARTGGAADRGQARAALGIPVDAPVTMMFGQLRLDKGLDDLLVAVSSVPGLWLIIAGEDLGALQANEQLLRSSKLSGRVILREGFLEMAQAAELFAATDTVALPYEVASQSGVLLLAYGFRRPVIAYPVGGLIEAVQDGETGWLCAACDPQALARALADSVARGSEECARRGLAGERMANDRFGWPAIARSTGEVYREVLAGVSDASRGHAL
ncbi:MAG: glycosyltransferase family 4 protein [Solirubrobacteraceae bacterium]